MRVYATEKVLDEIIVLEFFSQKAYREHNGGVWAPHPYISVVTFGDLGAYEFEKGQSGVVLSDDQIRSHNLLHKIYKRETKCLNR